MALPLISSPADPVQNTTSLSITRPYMLPATPVLSPQHTPGPPSMQGSRATSLEEEDSTQAVKEGHHATYLCAWQGSHL